MKVSKNILDMLLEDDRFRRLVAADSGISEAGILVAAKRNSESLTKIKTLQAISQHTGLPIESIIEQNQPA